MDHGSRCLSVFADNRERGPGPSTTAPGLMKLERISGLWLKPAFHSFVVNPLLSLPRQSNRFRGGQHLPIAKITCFGRQSHIMSVGFHSRFLCRQSRRQKASSLVRLNDGKHVST